MKAEYECGHYQKQRIIGMDKPAASVVFDHERLDVYRVSLHFVAWAYRLSKELKGLDRAARDQMLRASQSILLNLAEGNGKPATSPDRRRFLQIAYGSALECAAILDVLRICETINPQRSDEGKRLLARIVSMLIKMTALTNGVREDEAVYPTEDDET